MTELDADDSQQRHSPSGQYVQSLERGLAVIRAFDEDHERLTLSEVARITGLTRAAARRFLLTLETLGYVRSNGREFSLTAQVLELGFAYLGTLPFRKASEPTLEWLSEETGQSCSVSVLDGPDIVYVARVHTRTIMRVSISIGTRFPAYATSMGRVLLGGMSDEELQHYVHSGERTALTTRTTVQKADIRAAVLQAREQGWALVNQELEEGLCSLAVPVRNTRGAVVAALNISIPSQRVDAMGGADAVVEKHLPTLQRAARELERISQVSPIE